ncbi:hypothetical protein [Marinifilum caeruleilacunae]|uniref:Uncharacterized protein n=1 Tax=Marinifilum caeruleilacunae TaxID=2499076 RepID=A0ABX1WSE1_9BACT|nr:hypothetical protein [Marinifilum caeruleilacunae]NOU59023.1 hypothetical protein [Marinifilum caeruleilacunae]
MKLIKKVYIYWFCAVNKTVSTTAYWGMIVIRTIAIMMLFETLILATIGSTFSYLSKEIIVPKYPGLTVLLLCGGLLGIKYLIFLKNDQWKTYIEEFDLLSKQKKKLIYVFTALYSALIILAFFYLISLLSKADWVPYS